MLQLRLLLEYPLDSQSGKEHAKLQLHLQVDTDADIFMVLGTQC